MSESLLPLTVPTDHPAYAGHFPGQPILPGVVLLDAALYALAKAHGTPEATALIKSAKFLSPVLPGEPLTLHYTASGTSGFQFELRSDARAVASGAIVFTQVVPE